AEEALVDPRRAEHLCAEVADEGHRRETQHAARDEHRDSGRICEGGGDEEAVRDDDELAFRAQLERQVVRRRARVERDGLPLPNELCRVARDRSLSLDLEAEPQVEAGFRLTLLEGPHAAADARAE